MNINFYGNFIPYIKVSTVSIHKILPIQLTVKTNKILPIYVIVKSNNVILLIIWSGLYCLIECTQ